MTSPSSPPARPPIRPPAHSILMPWVGRDPMAPEPFFVTDDDAAQAPLTRSYIPSPSSAASTRFHRAVLAKHPGPLPDTYASAPDLGSGGSGDVIVAEERFARLEGDGGGAREGEVDEYYVAAVKASADFNKILEGRRAVMAEWYRVEHRAGEERAKEGVEAAASAAAAASGNDDSESD